MIFPPGTPTQPEIIALALSKLGIKKTDIFVDIGCGSGSVSIAAAGYAKQVVAIDSRNEAVLATSANIKEAGIKNIEVIKGNAETLLLAIELDCAFIGGSQKIEKILRIMMQKGPARFVVSAVKIETVALALDIMKKNNVFKELLQIQLSRGNELAGGIMLKPENPVFLISGENRC
ncbi:MAG: precorrin-6Y C5,15-methyltransferase (decarboxylating) subunit CbiT [Candidatus Methanoperedens sp.]|nr:precorrin-6Y C5,15-methyltransferase (decarboxylating) subunit CbiT [Candidatus Methanoperedens sp.]